MRCQLIYDAGVNQWCLAAANSALRAHLRENVACISDFLYVNVKPSVDWSSECFSRRAEEELLRFF